jgi:glutamate carboxypeptidase
MRIRPNSLRFVVAAATSLVVAHAVQAQSTLSASERAIVRAVDAHNAEALALLERLVNINSGTMNFAGVRKVGDVLRAEPRCAWLQDPMG